MPVQWIAFFFYRANIVTILKALMKPSDIFTLLQPTDGVVRKLSKISIAINLYQAHGAFHLVNLSTIKEFFFWELIIGSDHMGFRKSHLYLVANYSKHKHKHNFIQFECYISKYCKVASRSTSWLVAHPRIFRLFINWNYYEFLWDIGMDLILKLGSDFAYFQRCPLQNFDKAI